MEFMLTYDGPLATNGRPSQKHEIRRALHPQLAELWQHEPLKHSLDHTEADGYVWTEVGGHGFTSVVHSFWNFRAKLDILMLKPEPPGRILTQSGDIDNRLKTLFDALTQPVHAQDIPTGWTPTPDEEPLHCVFEDDSLIRGVSVQTDRLLAAKSPSHVKLFIKVEVSTAWVFGGFAIISPP